MTSFVSSISASSAAWKSAEEVEYFAELKFDGASLSLTYVDSVLETAATRGDGTTGEKVDRQRDDNPGRAYPTSASPQGNP